MSDEVIAEIRSVRHEISRRCNHDIHEVVAYYREFQEQLRQAGGYQFAAKEAASDKSEPDHVVASQKANPELAEKA